MATERQAIDKQIGPDDFERVPDSAYFEYESTQRRWNGNGQRTSEAARTQPKKLYGINFADMRAHLADGYIIKGLIKPATLVASTALPVSGTTCEARAVCSRFVAGRNHRVAAGVE